MRTYYFKKISKAAALAFCIFFLGTSASVGQTVVNLTAAPTTATLPDGSTVPMWGYFCNNDPALATPTTPGACASLNPKAAGWSPVVLTVATGQNLTIN